MQWQTKTLGEICDEANGDIRTGPFGSQLHESDYRNQGLPVVMPRDIINGKISTQGIARIGEDDGLRLKQHKLKKGDIVYGRRGDIGRRALITEAEDGWLCGTGCLRISLGETILDPAFLFYYLGHPDITAWIANRAIGATLPNLNTTIIRSVPIKYPDLDKQRLIGHILTAYDDLIENNTRRISILEQAARDLYQEWFVNFRFPGYEDVRLVNSGTDEYGMVPDGWGVKPFGEILTYHIGGGWGESEKSEDFNVPAYVIRGTDIPDTRHVRIDACPFRFHKQSSLESRLLQKSDIVFEVSGGSKGQPVGRALMISRQLLDAFDAEVICASFCKLIRVNGAVLLPEIAYLHLLRIYDNGQINKYQVQSTGITNFKFAHFIESEMLLIPSEGVQARFIETIRPLFDQIQTLGLKNSNLRTTRDLLLPHLVSGELDVSEMSVAEGE